MSTPPDTPTPRILEHVEAALNEMLPCLPPGSFRRNKLESALSLLEAHRIEFHAQNRELAAVNAERDALRKALREVADMDNPQVGYDIHNAAARARAALNPEGTK